MANPNNDQPLPWLKSVHPSIPNENASFVEYLRWMRSPDAKQADGTKVQILQMAADKSGKYQQRLTQLTERIKRIAGENNTFQVECLWRIRVGGHRGPEQILLPAFDALGMPYIPASTLRGVARNQAIREIMAQDNIAWKEAEKKVAPWFGSLEAKTECDRAGKIIFLDAYPLPSQGSIIAVDMVNNLWSWNGNSLEYKPNPNPFLSLKKATFTIGLRPTNRCDTTTFNRVKNWLIQGLQLGIGSQVNTGYGELVLQGKNNSNQPFLEVGFTLTGQLVHGFQRFNNIAKPFKRDDKGELKSDSFPEAELRPAAFKSMLRYWFRAFALGFLSVDEVKQWEHKLFGSLYDKNQGWVKFNVTEIGKPPNKQDKGKPCLEQRGTLKLSFSGEACTPKERKMIIVLFRNLTWLMFHLGGVGQGARRPLYCRENRNNAQPPWYRGVNLRADKSKLFGELPSTLSEFSTRFRIRLKHFYIALNILTKVPINLHIAPNQNRQWSEVADRNCRIVVCASNGDAPEFPKPDALKILHDNGNYDPSVCGNAKSDPKPSPVWIANLGNYQVVTIFGATTGKRQEFLNKLRQKHPNKCLQVFPL